MTPETRDEMTDFGPRLAQALPRVDHEIGAAALFPVAHLGGEDGAELLVRHPRPPEHAAALHMRGRRHDDGGIDVGMAAALEEQRDVERDDRRAVLPRRREERLLRLPHHRMHDRLKAAARPGVPEHRRAELRAVDTVRPGRPRKRRLDRRERRAAGPLQPVHLRIGVEHGNARASQHRRDGRLAHADRTGEAEDDHRVSNAFSSSSQPSGGATPKNSEKAIAAWPISISSPSTVSMPRAAAAFKRPVSSGLYTMS